MTDGGYTATEAWNLQLQARIAPLEAALRPFAKAWQDEMFLWSRDDLERFRREGIPTSNPRYGDGTPVYCVISPGEDHEDRSDDSLFAVGDLRGAFNALLGRVPTEEREPTAVDAFLGSAPAKFILGIPCFRFIQEAQLWRATGADIPKRAEDEQAFFLGLLLKLAAEHGDKWNEAFAREIEERQARLSQQDRVAAEERAP